MISKIRNIFIRSISCLKYAQPTSTKQEERKENKKKGWSFTLVEEIAIFSQSQAEISQYSTQLISVDSDSYLVFFFTVKSLRTLRLNSNLSSTKSYLQGFKRQLNQLYSNECKPTEAWLWGFLSTSNKPHSEWIKKTISWLHASFPN